MTHPTWHSRFTELNAQGLDVLTAEERATRWLPLDVLCVMPEVFQPRQHLAETAASGSHVAELGRALGVCKTLAALEVIRVGGRWIVIDGHHRLLAFQQAKGRRTKAPVHVFEGTTLDEALHFSINANSEDHLPLSLDDKRESAWVLVVRGVSSIPEISRTAKVSESSVDRMRRALRAARLAHPLVSFETWTWAEMRRMARGEPQNLQGRDVMLEAKAKEVAVGLAKHFHALPKRLPDAFALGLLKYDREAAKAIAQHVLRETRGDDPGEF